MARLGVCFRGVWICALVLALVGLYGIVTYTVAQRQREIAIRIALGSSYTRVIKMIVGSVASLGGIGAGLGLLLAMGAGRRIRTLLYNVEPLDFDALIVPAGGFLILVLLIAASRLPGRRAYRLRSPSSRSEDTLR